MKKLLIAIAMLSAMLLGIGTAFAATSQIDNLVGGAAITYFQVSAKGHQTLIDLHNADLFAPIRVHAVVFNNVSFKVVDFQIPLSPGDDWEAAVSNVGAAGIKISPNTCYATFIGANNGCFNTNPLTPGSLTVSAGIPADADGIQRGYITFVIDAGDNYANGDLPTIVNLNGGGLYGPINPATFADGDPRNDPSIIGVPSWKIPDAIFVRTAYINPGFKSASAKNAWMIQGFLNMLNFNESPVGAANSGWDSVFDVPTPGGSNYNCNATVTDIFTGRDGAFAGASIDAWELYITHNNLSTTAFCLGAPATAMCANGGWPLEAGALVVEANPFVVRNDVIYPAVGSANKRYWARWNENATVNSHTGILVVFPAFTGTSGYFPTCNQSVNDLSIFRWDDNESWQSAFNSGNEVRLIVVADLPTPSDPTAGELEMSTGVQGAPMLGFALTESGEFADAYPIIKERTNVILSNLLIGNGGYGQDLPLNSILLSPTGQSLDAGAVLSHIADPAKSEVGSIGMGK